MLAWVPDYLSGGRLDPLPGGVEVAEFPSEPLTAPGLERVELVVPPFRRDLADALAAMSALRVVQTDSAGIDWIAGAMPDGVVLCNARGVYDVPVAEWVAAVVLALARNLPDSIARQARGEWREDDWSATELAGRSALIVGYGAIGRAVEARLEAFDMTVERVARTARAAIHAASELPDLLPDADVVVVVAPLTEETRGLVDAGFLAAMRDGAVLVNAGRGAIVQTDALLAELESGRLRAALDVTDPEPLPPEHPLWRAPGALITPHVAGNTEAAFDRAAQLVRWQLERQAEGLPLLNVVDG
jgi:phosphoglycerate dehydrogenase-like enzyme